MTDLYNECVSVLETWKKQGSSPSMFLKLFKYCGANDISFDVAMSATRSLVDFSLFTSWVQGKDLK